MQSFEKLRVWQESRALAVAVYEVTVPLRRHHAEWVRQLTRAADSVPANIAEGAGHDSAREFARFLGIAIASVHEVQNHLLLGRDTRRIRDVTADALLLQVESVRRMLIKLKRRVQGAAS